MRERARPAARNIRGGGGFARAETAGQRDPQHRLRSHRCGCPRRAFAAVTVFCISIAMVSAPTPPGTGVYAPESAKAAGSISPTTVEPRLANCSARAASPGKKRCDLGGIRHAVDPDVDQRRAGLDHLRRDKAGAPDGRDQNLRLRVNCGRSRVLLWHTVTVAECVQQQHGRGFADDVRPSDDYRVLAGDGDPAALQDLDDSRRRTWSQSRAVRSAGGRR